VSVQTFSYDSDLIGGSLQVRESRIVAGLLLQNASAEHWYEVIQQENRLQKRTPASAKRVAQALRKRLERLDAAFWRAIRDGDDELATQVVCHLELLPRGGPERLSLRRDAAQADPDAEHEHAGAFLGPGGTDH